MSTGKIKIGVLGCANIAKRSIIPAIKALSDTFELVAIASRTMEKANTFANLFDCAPICGYQQLIDRKDISALYIPLPTGLHKEWIGKALRAGKHVYAEKSIAFTAADALEMVRLAELNNLALMEGYMFVYHAQHTITQDLVKKGEIGEIRSFSSWFGFPPLDKSNFRYNLELGGGVVFDAAGYPLRAAHLLLGPDLRVTSSSLQYSPLTATALYGNAFLQNKQGVAAHISFGFDNFYRCSYELWGSKGKLTATKAFTPKVDEQPVIIVENEKGIVRILALADNQFQKALMAFAASIKEGAIRHANYEAIVRQSASLDRIIELSKYKQ